VATPHLLSDPELGFVVLKVNDVLGACYDDPEEHADDSNAILKPLMAISSTAPAHVRDQTLPLLLSFLPASTPARNVISARARYQHVLSALSALCGPPPLFATLVEALTPRLVAVVFPSPSSYSDGCEEDPELPAASRALLTKRNCAVMKVLLAFVLARARKAEEWIQSLWAQKFATGILPRLMSGAFPPFLPQTIMCLMCPVHRFRPPARHLIALTSLIKAISNAAYAHEMTQARFAVLCRFYPTHDIRLQLMPLLLANAIEALLAVSATGTHVHS
jgi:hypothetical protein